MMLIDRKWELEDREGRLFTCIDSLAFKIASSVVWANMEVSMVISSGSREDGAVF